MSPTSPDAGLMRRLRHKDCENLFTLCKMHFCVLFDLDKDNFEMLFGETNEETKDESKGVKALWFRKRKSSRADHLDRETLPPYTQTLAPLERLIRHLHTEDNMSQEGLFRKPGNLARQKDLKERLASPEGAPGYLDLALSCYSAHDCACVLKTLLGEMPEPLLTDKLYLALCRVPELETAAKQVKAMQLLMAMLPPENCCLLKDLLALLHDVARTQTSRMTNESLGTIFAPGVLCPRQLMAMELQSNIVKLQKTVAIMVEHSNEIFEVPMELMRDIKQKLEHEGNSGSPGRDMAVMTSLTFAARGTPTKDLTQRCVEALGATIASMPDSSKKKKYMKKFNQAQEYAMQAENKRPQSKRSRSKSVGERIKKHFRISKRRTSNNAEDCRPSAVRTPDSANSSLPTPTPGAKSEAIKRLTMHIGPQSGHAGAEAAGSQPDAGMVISHIMISSSVTPTARRPMAILNVSDTCIHV